MADIAAQQSLRADEAAMIELSGLRKALMIHGLGSC
jgi:hypothetical protein